MKEKIYKELILNGIVLIAFNNEKIIIQDCLSLTKLQTCSKII
jgi:hypothetical protein